MKKKIILFLLIGVLLGVALATAVYFIFQNDIDWRTYIETTLVPLIASAAASIFALYMGAVPLYKIVRSAAGALFTATDKVEITASKGEQSDLRLEEYGARIASFEDRFDSIEQMLQDTAEGYKSVARIMQLGFGNMDELVRKGYAAKIKEVDADGEKKTKI